MMRPRALLQGTDHSKSETFMHFAYQTWDRERMYGLQTILIGEGEEMKKLFITGFALCFMGLAAPSFAAARQPQNQQDQLQKDDSMKQDDMSKDSISKDNMSKDNKSKKKMKKDNMKKDDGMKHDDMKQDNMSNMSKDAPKN